MDYNTKIGNDLQFAAMLLQQGELVAIPTETVYGLAANALDEKAVLKIFKAKERPLFNPLILHFPYWNAALPYLSSAEIPTEFVTLAQYLLPGPISFLLPKNPARIGDLVTAGSAKVAIRVPAHPVAHALLNRLGFPLAAPSANRFGNVSPVTPQHVLSELEGRIPYILDGSASKVGVESTILDYENGRVILRRAGGISKEQIESIIGGEIDVQTSADTHPVAPGMLKSHYAPAKPMFLVEENVSQNTLTPYKKWVVIAMGTNEQIQRSINALGIHPLEIFNLSTSNNLDEAASNLFSAMRLADNSGADGILAFTVPNVSLGVAINDRLKKASFKPIQHD